MTRTSLVTLLAITVGACAGEGGRDSDSASAGTHDTTATSTATATGGETEGASASGTGGEDFGDEVELVLRLNDAPVPPLALSLGREAVLELFGASAKEIVLAEVDSTPLLSNALAQIRSACGDAWEVDDPEPNHDCSQTALGQTFKGPDDTWKSSPEYALVRLLTMTPANARVEGTSIEGMQTMADFFDIGGGFSQILSESLGITRTEPFIDLGNLIAAIQTDLLASHPAIGGDGTVLPVSLYDALTDLASLAEKFGPTGDHPGIVDPEFPIKSQVLSDAFSMDVSAESNLRLLDGVDLSAAAASKKGYMSTVVDVTPPTFDDELEFDFFDPAKFSISGVVEDPVVDMRFAVFEHDDFIDSCAGDNLCQDNLPENHDQVKKEWPGSVWAQDPWLIEHLVARGARGRFGQRIFSKCYVDLGFYCSANVVIGPDEDHPGSPPGWSLFEVMWDLGNPPKDQYVWELINEIAQVALHRLPDATLPEGSADVAFTLYQIPVGVSGSAILEASRPKLQEQASKLSDLILGDYWKNNDPLDFYYRRGADGVPYLFFVAAGDLPPGSPYGYARPGFFTCPALDAGCKASALELAGAGDSEHEKVALPGGESVFYVEDDEGGVYRLRVLVGDGEPAEITVRVAGKGG